MLSIAELNFGYRDAENYKRRENKQLFNNIFFHTDSLKKIAQNNCFFLIGEKGTGKTAYAVYCVNNNYANTSAHINYIRETDYQKFISLKKTRHLELSDYVDIWKVIIYLLISKNLVARDQSGLFRTKFPKFQSLIKAIDEYYNNAFSPEILYALKFVEQAKNAAELISKHAKIAGEEQSQVSFSESKFQVNLLYIQKKFEDALLTTRLDTNNVLFIDGIDIRPDDMPYSVYIECVKGLANAVWNINNDFFPRIRDSKGRIRVVLLLRPDIFDSLGLQNQNNKLRDNSVLLDWRTTYPEYRTSEIFRLFDHLLKVQQKDKSLEIGKTWDYYFPFEAEHVKTTGMRDGSFISFLRFSYYRPRDVVTMLSILKDNFIEEVT